MYLALVIVVFSSLVGVAQGFLWKPRMLTSCSRSTQLNYSVKIVNQKKNVEFKVDVPPGKIILDTTESQGVPIPYSCRAGSCSTCVGKLISGSVDQSGQIFLNDKQIEDGYVLTCVATATSDCVIAVDVEDQFYQENPDLVQ